MRRRLGQVICSTLLLLIGGNGSLAAAEGESAAANTAALGQGTTINPSYSPKGACSGAICRDMELIQSSPWSVDVIGSVWSELRSGNIRH